MPKLNTNEVCAAFKVDRRTVSRWIKDGLPVEKGPSTGKGRPSNVFDEADIRRFLASNRSGVATAAKSVAPPPVSVESRPRERTRGSEIPPASEAGNRRERESSGDELLTVLDNLRDATAVTFAQWASALKRNRTQPGAYSVSELAAMERSWHSNVERQRQLEKDLPRILLERGRYRDINEIREAVVKAWGITSGELDRVGLAVASECEGKTARQIRTIVETAIAGCKRHIAKMLREALDADPE